MTRAEFMDVLQRTLVGSLTSSTVNENVRYYQEYFDTQMRMGQSGEEVAESLGDPRLLAKTLIEAAKNEGRSARPECDEVYEDGTQETGSGSSRSGTYRIPGWLIAVLVILVLLVVVGIVGSILSAMLPVIIPVVCVVLVIRYFQRRN